MSARRRRSERAFMQSAEAMNQGDDFVQRIRALEAIPGPPAFIYMKMFADFGPGAAVTTDPTFDTFEIGLDMDRMVLTFVEAFCKVAPSADIELQIERRDSDGGGSPDDMLSTTLLIEAGDKNSRMASQQPVVDVDFDNVAHGDHITVVVVDAGTGGEGLGVMLTFELLIPEPT